MAGQAVGGEELVINIDRIVAAVRRQLKVILFFCVVGAILGVAYIVTAKPLFTASVQLLIDDPQANAESEESNLTVRFEPAKIDSQVELIKSERIASFVVRKLNLETDKAFMAPATSFVAELKGQIKSVFDFGEPVGDFEVAEPEQTDLLRSAVAKVQKNMSVRRIGRTYVLEISYTSADPQQAARIANAYADAYLVDQLEAKYDATRRASAWLQERIGELREQSLASDLAVQKFRAEKDLISAEGVLLGEQQLADVNSQLIVARAETAQAEAKYRRIRDIIDTGQMDAAVTEALNNPVIARLRSDFLESSKRYAEISSKLGGDHIQAIKFQNEMAQYQRVIFDELGRIAQSYRSDYTIAQTREDSLEKSLAALAGATKGTNENLVTLRDLERDAETYKNLYQSFLERYQQNIQQQSFPVTKARVISSASAPEGPSYPSKTLSLALSLVFGGMIGVGCGAFREYQDRGFRTGEQVRERLGLEFLGMLTKLPKKPIVEQKANNKEPKPQSQQIEAGNTIMRQTLDAPLTGFAETLRAAKIAADLMLGEKKSKIIGVISTLPGEGKSTTSKNLASLLANLGAKTLLIDCDLRNPGLSRSIAPNAETGLLDVFLEGRSIESVALTEVDSGLVFLPSVSRQRVSHTSEILASPSMKKLLTDASDHFEYIVVDLPPLAPVVDVRAIADQVDAFLFVVEWGKTVRQSVQSAIENDRRLSEKCLGVVLNKVDLKKQKMYENYNSDGYKNSAYVNYYDS